MVDVKQYFFFILCLKCKDTVFNPQLLKAADEKSKDTQGPTVFMEKPEDKWACAIQIHVVQDQLYNETQVKSTQ